MSNGNTHTQHLFQLELDGGTELVGLVSQIVLMSDGGGEFAGLVQTRTQKTRQQLDQRIGGNECIILLCHVLVQLLVLVQLFQIFNRHRWHMQYEPISKQITSTPYLLLVLLMCVYMLRFNFYIASVDDQLKQYLPEQASDLKWLYDLMLPLGGVIAVAPIGWILDTFAIHNSFILLLLMGMSFGSLSMVSAYWAQVGAICIFVVMRPMFYTCASEFVARVYGFTTFGKVYGLITLTSGLFNFIQAWLLDVTRSQLNHDFTYANIGLTTAVFIFASLFPIYITLKHYKYNKERRLTRHDDDFSDSTSSLSSLFYRSLNTRNGKDRFDSFVDITSPYAFEPPSNRRTHHSIASINTANEAIDAAEVYMHSSLDAS